MGFCDDDAVRTFMGQAPVFEQMLLEAGVNVTKFWFSVTQQSSGPGSPSASRPGPAVEAVADGPRSPWTSGRPTPRPRRRCSCAPTPTTPRGRRSRATTRSAPGSTPCGSSSASFDYEGKDERGRRSARTRGSSSGVARPSATDLRVSATVKRLVVLGQTSGGVPGQTGGMTEHLDVVVIGAGLSGIGAGYRLQTECPDTSSPSSRRATRSAAPGTCSATPASARTRTCSPSATRSEPWRGAKSIADGADDPRATSARPRREYGIDRHIRYSTEVVSADWSSDEARWTVTLERRTGERATLTCGFLYSCAGYYDYDRGYTPEFPGIERLRRARSSTRSSGPRTSTTPASGSSSSAAARPPSRSSRRWPSRPRT